MVVVAVVNDMFRGIVPHFVVTVGRRPLRIIVMWDNIFVLVIVVLPKNSILTIILHFVPYHLRFRSLCLWSYRLQFVVKAVNDDRQWRGPCACAQ